MRYPSSLSTSLSSTPTSPLAIASLSKVGAAEASWPDGWASKAWAKDCFASSASNELKRFSSSSGSSSSASSGSSPSLMASLMAVELSFGGSSDLSSAALILAPTGALATFPFVSGVVSDMVDVYLYSSLSLLECIVWCSKVVIRERGVERGNDRVKTVWRCFSIVLSEVFKLENRWQAKLLGAEKEDYRQARKLIEETVSNNNIVIYTYKLSLFSAEAMGVLDEIGAGYENVEVGLEWFLLDKEKSVLRAELLKMTGQSSLPHVFINGKHVGGLFTGSEDGTYPGLAGLKESGELMKMVAQGLDVAS
mmetsp:Transcript_31232/g.66949  ORF Transcript_31232/g.66949 Transcript_31232/m.66949 type:complete len:308 (+) Transcript_31232:340-1263(+)